MYILLIFLFLFQVSKENTDLALMWELVQAHQVQFGQGLSLVVFFDPALALWQIQKIVAKKYVCEELIAHLGSSLAVGHTQTRA